MHCLSSLRPTDTRWSASGGQIRPPAAGRSSWDPKAGILDSGDLEDFDAIVHLAGETIVGRWTPEKKARILESRVKGTRLLCESLVHLRNRPIVLVSASAVGYYGNRGERGLERGKLARLNVSFEGNGSLGSRHATRGARRNSRGESAHWLCSQQNWGRIGHDAYAFQVGPRRASGKWTPIPELDCH